MKQIIDRLAALSFVDLIIFLSGMFVLLNISSTYPLVVSNAARYTMLVAVTSVFVSIALHALYPFKAQFNTHLSQWGLTLLAGSLLLFTLIDGLFYVLEALSNGGKSPIDSVFKLTFVVVIALCWVFSLIEGWPTRLHLFTVERMG